MTKPDTQTHIPTTPQAAPAAPAASGSQAAPATTGSQAAPAATATTPAATVPEASASGPTPVADAIRAIKAELRAAMNGVAAARIRQSGMNYRLVFGTELPRLQAIAAEFQPGANLAQALWHEDIRECKLLATMLYPPKDFCEELADIWADALRMEQAEVAQVLAMNLLSKVPYASQKAFEWMASDRPMHQMLGFLLVARLLMQGGTLSPSAEEEFLDQAAATIHAPQLAVQKAVQNALLRYGQTSDQAWEKTTQILCTSPSCNTTSNGAGHKPT